MNIKNFNYNKEEIKQFQKTSDINLKKINELIETIKKNNEDK